MRIPISQTDLTGRETEYVNQALRNNWISCGPFMAKAESEFANLCQVKHAVMVNSGTSALHLALAGLGLGQGDEIICPSLTYIATAAAIVQVGATPVFCDVSIDSWCIEAPQIEELITPRTRAVLLVDLYGNVSQLDPILELARIHNLVVLGDCAESHGALYKGKPSSSYMDAACYSFYANKPITGGELGAVVTNDSKIAAHLVILRGQGQDPRKKFAHPVVGFNFRPTDLQCAVLVAQLERFDSILEKRRNIFLLYRKYLDGIPGIGFKPTPRDCLPCPWLFCITVDKELYGHTRDELMAVLDENGVETRTFFQGAHTMIPYRQQHLIRGEWLPNTEKLSAVGMNLPTFNMLTEEQICDIALLIAAFHKPKRSKWAGWGDTATWTAEDSKRLGITVQNIHK